MVSHGNLYFIHCITFIVYICLTDVDFLKCAYIIHISLCRSKIHVICFKFTVFLYNLSRLDSLVAMETKTLNILVLLVLAFVNETMAIESLYVSFIYTFAVRR